MEDLLYGLNDAQRAAVTMTEGCVRVIAGAGSGKTRALTRRFAYLVDALGIQPGSILCVTFTNKAANEMRERIHNLTGDSDTGYICTFHSFCVSVLQEESHALQYPKSFLVLDNADINVMLRLIYEERGLTLRDMSFADARDMIEIEKCRNRPDYYLDMLELSQEALREKYLRAVTARDIIFYGYLWQEKKCFALDYNDLINFTLYLFSRDAQTRLKWQKRLEYIMIDEFQDIDGLQYELMSVLCDYHKNLFIVGDPDQTIYTWRGADVKYLLDFDKAFPNVKTILMTENYRSTPQILAAVNSLIAQNRTRIPKQLQPMLPGGETVLCHCAPTAQDEAAWIAARIGQLRAQGAAWRDVTLLYRSHYVSRTVEDVLRRAEIPYALYSGVPFYGRAEIKDALSYLRLIAYRDDLSFLRVVNVPKRNLGERRREALKALAVREGCSLYEALRRSLEDELFRGTKAAQLVAMVEQLSADAGTRPISELLAAALERSGYEKMLRTEGAQERLDNLAELRQSVYEYETSCGEEAALEHYLAHIALFTNADTAESGDKVKLMTVHAAKGLEFPYVFLCGLNEGIFPSKRTRTLPAMEEERRLAFVAMTRAQRGLFLTAADGRNFDGSPRYPSRFVLDIDAALLCFQPPLRDTLIADAREYIAHTRRWLPESEESPALAPGQRVRHSVFGAGTVEAVDREKGVHLIRFDDLPTPRALAFRAKLERL